MENLLNNLIQIKCFNCGNLGYSYCPECLKMATPIINQHCIICDKESPDGYTHPECRSKFKFAPTRCTSLFTYSELVRKCIRESKYGRLNFASLRQLSDFGAIYVKNLKEDFGNSIIVPIPSSKKNIERRGFNQATLIGESFCRQLELPSAPELLIRVKDTKSNHSLKRSDRFENTKHAFIGSNLVKGKTILLVDDIITSGATLLWASFALYSAGACNVRCLILSKKFLL